MQKYFDDSQEFRFQDLLQPYESINISLRVDFLHVNNIVKPEIDSAEIYPKQDFEEPKGFKFNSQ